MPIVRVIVRGGHLATRIWHLVLTQPNIQVTISINIAAGQHLAVFQVRVRGPHQSSRISELAFRRALEQDETFEFSAEKISDAVPIKISNDSGEN